MIPLLQKNSSLTIDELQDGFILLIDKEKDWSSFDVVKKVRNTVRIKKVGHAGTLDPLATGLLLVAVGNCTRLIEYMVATDKGYHATFKLGLVTDSQDITGTVQSEHDCTEIVRRDIERVCREFVGDIDQVPPMFSALKKDGVPLYRLARKGIEVERQKRRITITRLDIEEFCGDTVTIDVDCSKGTYIRTLCHDIGQSLGCGACMTSLRRTRSGTFNEKMAISLDSVISGDFDLLPPGVAVATLPELVVNEQGWQRLRNGIPPQFDDICGGVSLDDMTMVRLMYADKVLAIACCDGEHQLDQRGDFKLHKVFPDGI